MSKLEVPLGAQPFSMNLSSAVEHDTIECVIPKMLSQYFSALGRKSVKARLKKLSARERQDIARNAAKARWAKSKTKKKRRSWRKR
jgi:hypothetical protein